jgi:hypothetical protein
MRGCLSVIVLAVVFVAAVGWLAGPPAAGFVIEAGLTAGGLQSSDLDVTVQSDPPWEVLTGRADRVRITGRQATLRGSTIDELDLELREVAVLDRSARTVDGRLEGVVVHSEGIADDLRIVGIELSGGDPIRAAVEIDDEEVEELVRRGVRERTGRDPRRVAVESPDRMVIAVDELTIDGRLRIDDAGSLVLRTGGAAGEMIGDLVLVGAADLPVAIDSVAVRDGRLLLGGVLEPGLLGGG